MSDRDGLDRLLAAVSDAPPPEVTADLTVTVDGTPLRVTSFTDLVRVDAGTVRDVVRVGRSVGRDARLVAALSAAGLTAEVTVDGTTVARLGTDATPGPVGRRLGGIELRPTGLLAATLRSPY